MNFFTTGCIIEQKIYEAGAALVRYMFIRASLQIELQETYGRNKFIYRILIFPQVNSMNQGSQFPWYVSCIIIPNANLI